MNKLFKFFDWYWNSYLDGHSKALTLVFLICGQLIAGALFYVAEMPNAGFVFISLSGLTVLLIIFYFVYNSIEIVLSDWQKHMSEEKRKLLRDIAGRSKSDFQRD